MGCAEAKCKKSYHLSCGNTHKALFQFYDQFKSYCREHRHSYTVLEDFESTVIVVQPGQRRGCNERVGRAKLFAWCATSTCPGKYNLHLPR